MASIILRAFGGMAPSANDKAINEAQAVYAQNLNQRFTDFRPLPIPATAGTATAGETLYRFESSGGFITRAGQVNFVRGPIPTDTTERTYYTGDGVPSVTDSGGSVRQLGVPAPVAAPTVTVNVVDEYSEDDVAAAQAKALADLTTAIWDTAEHPYVGVTDAQLLNFENSIVPGVWRYISRGTFVAGQFVPTNRSHRNLVDDRLGFAVLEFPGPAGYAGFTSLAVRAFTVKIGAGMSAVLQAIPDPSDVTGVKKLISASDAATIIANLTNDLKAADIARDAAVPKVRALLDEFVALADNGSPVADSMKAAVAEFYATPAIAGQIATAILGAVSSIRNALGAYNTPYDTNLM